MKPIRTVALYLVAVLFIVSGFVKLVDPMGTGIKLEEYLVVFADQFWSGFSILERYTLFFSILLSSLEIVLGVALLVRFQMVKMVWLLLGIIVFFTFLTFYSAYTGEVTDCGCFGDAMPLTPWQSFTKDLVLLVFVGIIFWQKQKYTPVIPAQKATIAVVLSTLFCVFFAAYNLDHLPVIDFRQYKIGTHIREKMQDGKPGVYHYVMTKEGEEQVFETYPTDASWTFKEMLTIQEPTLPTINDFALFDEQGDNLTEQVLTGNTILIVSKKISLIRLSGNSDVQAFVKNTENAGFKFYYVTGSDFEETKALLQELDLQMPVLQLDETVVKAMIRANPGIMILSDGVVLGKYNYKDAPTLTEIDELFHD